MNKNLETNHSPTHPRDNHDPSPEEIEERLLEEVVQLEEKYIQSAIKLVKIYSQTGRLEAAARHVEILIALSINPETTAFHYLSLGCLMEQMGDYRRAVGCYRQGMALEPCRKHTWYYLHNNLGFSLNQLRDYDNATPCLQRAIEIDPALPNAYKNLGLALGGKGLLSQAAALFVTATQTEARDSRSLGHLERLIMIHPEILIEWPELRAQLEACREAVAFARVRQTEAKQLLAPESKELQG